MEEEEAPPTITTPTVAPTQAMTTPTISTPTVEATPTPVQVVKPTVRQEAVDDQLACPSVTTSYLLPVRASVPNAASSGSAEGGGTSEGVNPETGPEEKAAVENTEVAEEEPEFDWNEYLEASGSIAAPPTLFPHVEASLQTLFTEDMKLEVPNRLVEPGAYWVATVVMSCGPLLRLRYEGYESGERFDDFWCEIVSGEIRPVGWCAEQGLPLRPPPLVAAKAEWAGPDWTLRLEQLLAGCVTVPPYLLESNGCTAIDQIKVGMKFEVQDDLNLTHVWIATVMENVGGRMLLRYDGITSGGHDFWLFYLSFRVHPFGWARGNECTYKPPTVLLPQKTVSEWANILNDSMSAACQMSVPPIIFQSQETVASHEFREGMRLEALDPVSRTRVCLATVVKVLNRFYFNVQLDASGARSAPPPTVCCHSKTPTIFPPGWAMANLLDIELWDRENSCEEVDWKEYMSRLRKEGAHPEAQLAPKELFQPPQHPAPPVDGGGDQEGFAIGMKLEAVNPFQPQHISVATVCKVSANLIWIQLDNSNILFPNHVVACTSHDIFPVGWCDSNHYALKVPPSQAQLKGQPAAKKVAIVLPKQQSRSGGPGEGIAGAEAEKGAAGAEEEELAKEGGGAGAGRAWCPVIYFNHKCFTGPFLSITRIAGLPKQVGPGPIHLVLKEVISMIVGVSYLPSRCLSVLQAEHEAEPGTHTQLIKAKYKGRKYRSMVLMVSNSERVREYCRSVCRKLQCCLNLFGPDCFLDNCPENCYSLTKSNSGQVKRKKRKKKSKSFLVKAAEKSSTVAEKSREEDKCGAEVTAGSPTALLLPPEVTPKEVPIKCLPRPPVKSDMVTRGAKLPDFSGKRKLVSRSGSESGRKERKKDHAPCSSEEEEPFQMPYSNLRSNPSQWTIEQVSAFIKDTDCAPMARLLKEQEIDGQALLLLTLPTIQEHLELKLGPAIKLSNHIEQLKSAFYSQYGN